MGGAAAATAGELSLLLRLETLAPELHEAERKAADYLVAHVDEIVHMSITEMAEAAGTSQATVLRLARKLGYRGYAPMKIALAMELTSGVRPEPAALDTVAPDDLGRIKQTVLDASIAGLRDTAELLSDAVLSRTVEALVNARHVAVYGVGESAPVATHAAVTLSGVGVPAVVVTDSQQQVTSATQLRPGDVAFAISFSGRSRDTVEALEIARAASARTICLTRHVRAPLTRTADIVLLAASRQKATGEVALFDRVAQVAVLEVLRTACVLTPAAAAGSPAGPADHAGDRTLVHKARDRIAATKHV